MKIPQGVVAHLSNVATPLDEHVSQDLVLCGLVLQALVQLQQGAYHLIPLPWLITWEDVCAAGELYICTVVVYIKCHYSTLHIDSEECDLDSNPEYNF